MTSHVSNERMNEALDGVLPSAEVADIEQHLMECAPCRNEHARLSEVVSAIRGLPRAGAVPDEAWAGIAARIGSRDGGLDGRHEGPDGGAEEVKVLPLRRAAEGDAGPGARIGRRWSLSSTQLAAAAALVALVSATTVWIAIDGTTDDVFVAGAAPRGPAGGAAARAVSLDDGRYGEVVDQLQALLAEGRSVLAPETLATIEGSLQTVDAAIAEIEGALDDDPNSDLLRRMLSNHQRTKLGVLQRAVAAVQAQA